MRRETYCLRMSAETPPAPAASRANGASASRGNGVAPSQTPRRESGPVQQMTAGKIVELMQDVEASTPVWQLGDDDDLVPVYFVEVNRVNGLVERLVLK